MRNLTSLQGIKVVNSFPRHTRSTPHGTKRVSVARWDWDEVWGGIVQCPYCGQSDPRLWSKGKPTRTIKDIPVAGFASEIKLQCKRYMCRHCKSSFGTTHPGIKRNSNLTTTLVTSLALRARGQETHAQIARRAGVPESTVRKCFRDNLTPPKDLPTHPKAIGMDGLHVGKGKPSVVITALHLDETRGYHVLKVLEGDEHVRLRDYLNGLEPRQKPLPVVIDRSWTFKSAIEAARLPIALVLDRYHLARLGNLALGNARKELIGEDLEEDWEDRKQEIYNRAEASSGCQLRLDGMGTEKLDQMAAVYKATLWYQWILTADASREEATEMFREWRGALQPPIRKYFEGKVFGALEEPWRRGTLNYYDYPYTNGFNEGINNIGKELERIGAGYSNTTIQAKLRYSQSHTGLFDTGGSFKVWLDLFDARFSHADADTLRAHAYRAVANPPRRGSPAPPVEEVSEDETAE